jgi:hypothetical protein
MKRREGVFRLRLKRLPALFSSTAKQFTHEQKVKRYYKIFTNIYNNLFTFNCNFLSYGTKDFQVFLQMTTKGVSKVFFSISELASAHRPSVPSFCRITKYKVIRNLIRKNQGKRTKVKSHTVLSSF